VVALNCWWEGPDYKACRVLSLRGVFIIAKLHQRDAAKLWTVMVDLYRAEQKDPEDITKFEWETILRFMGASPEEIDNVQARMGRQWR